MFKEYGLFERVGTGHDALGVPVTQWSKIGQFDALKDMQTGDNRNRQNQDLLAESTHVLITDGMPEITPTTFHRVEDGQGRRYEINYVDNVGEVDDHLEIYISMLEGEYRVQI